MIVPLQNKRLDLSLKSPLGSIAVELTTRCNLHCKMCSYWKRQDKNLPYEKVKTLLDKAYHLGARRFDPWGTEIFMRQDIGEILSYADKIGYREIYAVSNGLLLNNTKLLDSLASLKSLVIVVSLDGPKDIHDKLRGTGIFDQAVSSVHELIRRGIPTSIASIIMRPTIGHLCKIIDLAADLNIPVISMQPYNRDLGGECSDHTIYEFRPDEKKIISNKMNYLLRYAKKKNVIIYTGNMIKYVASYLAEGVNAFPPRGCHVPSKTLVVDIDGNVHPCFEIKKNMGNVNETPLSSIWHSKIHNEFIISAKEKKCPGCLRACSDVEGYNNEIKNIFRQALNHTALRFAHHIKFFSNP